MVSVFISLSLSSIQLQLKSLILCLFLFVLMVSFFYALPPPPPSPPSPSQGLLFSFTLVIFLTSLLPLSLPTIPTSIKVKWLCQTLWHLLDVSWKNILDPCNNPAFDTHTCSHWHAFFLRWPCLPTFSLTQLQTRTQPVHLYSVASCEPLGGVTFDLEFKGLGP